MLWRFFDLIDLPDPPPLLGWEGWRGEDAYLVAAGQAGFGLLGPAGSVLLMNDYLGTDLKQLLATPGIVWVPAVEPWLAVSRTAATEGFQALAFAPDGTDVIDGVLRQGNLAGTTIDILRPSIDRPGSPSPRSDFAAVYSRSEDRAFIIGGRDAANQDLLGDLWLRQIEGPSGWRQVALGSFEVGEVLAATWSYADHRLWVLDEVDGPSGATARLYRVEPYLGAVLQVGSWLRLGHYDQHWLVLDRDGQVLLVASRSAPRKHTIVRLQATRYHDTAPLELSCVTSPKELAFAPLVHAAGYSFAWRNPKGKVLLQRKKKLHLTSCALADIASVL